MLSWGPAYTTVLREDYKKNIHTQSFLRYFYEEAVFHPILPDVDFNDDLFIRTM
jgi:hypothetical protein